MTLPLLHRIFVCGLIFVLCMTPGYSQRKPATTGAQGGQTSPASLHRLAAGDEIEITFNATPDQHQVVKVREDGWVYVSPLGDVQCAGRTLEEVRRVIEQRLSKVYVLAGVRIGLKSVAVPTAMIFGDVQKPGQYPVPFGTTLAQLVGMAGGTLSPETTEATLERGQIRRNVDITAPTSGTVQVLPGDIYYVPPPPKISVSVSGAVWSSGGITAKGKLTLWDAIIAAGGPKAEAALRRVIVKHKGMGKPLLLDLTAGPTAPDSQFLLASGDVVQVREQRVGVIGAGGIAGAAGGKGGLIPITGEENLLTVLAMMGISEKYQIYKIAIVRWKELTEGTPALERLKLSEAELSKPDVRAKLLISDGDIIIINPPRGPNAFLTLVAQLSLLRSLFGL